MTLTLRFDVDKPYGRATLGSKVLSKLREDYWFPAIDGMGYLDHVSRFLDVLTSENVPATGYFRHCTLPDERVLEKMARGGHQLGFHAEDTSSRTSFENELTAFRSKHPRLHSFTKHGSGVLKLGRKHYPPYEPDKYRRWSTDLGVPYYFGNEVVSDVAQFEPGRTFYPAMFWIEAEYRDPRAATLDWALRAAETSRVIVLIHPSNFYAIRQAQTDLLELVKRARASGIDWYAFTEDRRVREEIAPHTG